MDQLSQARWPGIIPSSRWPSMATDIRPGAALHVLQFLQGSPDVASHASDGSWPHRSGLEFGGIGGIIGAETSAMRIVKVIAVMFFGPLLGILAGFLVGVLAMPTQALTVDVHPVTAFLLWAALHSAFLFPSLYRQLWQANSGLVRARLKNQIEQRIQNRPLPRFAQTVIVPTAS
jgi:hypothetical protein